MREWVKICKISHDHRNFWPSTPLRKYVDSRIRRFTGGFPQPNHKNCEVGVSFAFGATGKFVIYCLTGKPVAADVHFITSFSLHRIPLPPKNLPTRHDLTMATQFQPSAQQVRDLRALRNLGADTIAAVAECLANLEKPSLKPTELLALVREQLSGNEKAAESVMRQGLSLNVLMRQSGMHVDSVLAGIRFGIEQEAEWSDEEIEAWNNIEPHFRTMLCTRAFRLVATAIDLSYDYANLFRKARILTDIRPLFTDDAESIEAAVVSCTLRLRYDSVDGEHELSVAMDEGDVRDLSEQCERALKKAQTARDTIRSRVNVPTVVTGERDNA